MSIIVKLAQTLTKIFHHIPVVFNLLWSMGLLVEILNICEAPKFHFRGAGAMNLTSKKRGLFFCCCSKIKLVSKHILHHRIVCGIYRSVKYVARPPVKNPCSRPGTCRILHNLSFYIQRTLSQFGAKFFYVVLRKLCWTFLKLRFLNSYVVCSSILAVGTTERSISSF